MSINILAMVNPTAINGTSLPDVRMGISNHSGRHLVIVIITLYRRSMVRGSTGVPTTRAWYWVATSGDTFSRPCPVDI